MAVAREGAKQSSKVVVEKEVLPEVVHSGWFTKKAPKARRAARKRYFVMYSDGMIRYFAAVSPDSEPVDEKGHFRIFKDTSIKTDGKVLLIAALSTCGLKAREWHLTAEAPETASEWKSKIEDVKKNIDTDSATHMRSMESKKAIEGSVIKKLGNKVASSMSMAVMTMRSFGFSGSITVSGMLMGLSVSMGVEVEAEEGEGEVEAPAGDNEADAEDDDDEIEAIEANGSTVKSTHDEAEDEEVDPTTADSPQKESKFKRTIKAGMRGAMKRVKVMAFEMKKYSLTGTVGVGVDATMFGTGITIDFEVSLSSCLSEVEFKEMQEHEKERSKARQSKKDAKRLSVSRRADSSIPAGSDE